MKMIDFRRQLLEATPCGTRPLDCDLYRTKDRKFIAVVTPFNPDGERFPVYVLPLPFKVAAVLFPNHSLTWQEYFPVELLEEA